MGRTWAVLAFLLCLPAGCRVTPLAGSCRSDTDCRDITRDGYDPAKALCHPTTHECVAHVDLDGGGGADARIDSLFGQPCGSDAGVCARGYCVDGVCCEQSSCGECKRCAPGTGRCENVSGGPAPEGQCGGDTRCGAGICDGAGNCGYKAVDSICEEVCDTVKGEEMVGKCNADHNCIEVKKACTPSICGTKRCLTGCSGNADCVVDSVCDRSEANVTGTGKCIDPSKVKAVSGGGSGIQGAINSLGTATHLRIAAGEYDAVGISGKTVTLIGDGTVKVSALLGPAISVQANSRVVLQGLVATSTAGPGVYCDGGISTSASMVIVESTIKESSGIGVTATNCDVNLYRCTIGPNNKGGGVKLDTGTFKLSDNLIVGNGTLGTSPCTLCSGLGGVSLSNGTGTVVFVNNTVADNSARSDKAAGIICSGGEVVRNSILSGNTSGPAQFLGCTFDHSDINPPGTLPSGAIGDNCQLDAEYKPAASTACHGGGDSSSASALDRAGTVRDKSGPADIGAFEVK